MRTREGTGRRRENIAQARQTTVMAARQTEKQHPRAVLRAIPPRQKQAVPHRDYYLKRWKKPRTPTMEKQSRSFKINPH
ncbi:unnamed protein product, partial [Trichogramma brassicae]